MIVAGSVFVATGGRGSSALAADRERLVAGETVWRTHRCQTCHSIYGLGGHMAMDLTNVIRDRGPDFVRLTVASGRNQMPAFTLTSSETERLLDYLTILDSSGESPLRGLDAPVFGRSHFEVSGDGP